MMQKTMGNIATGICVALAGLTILGIIGETAFVVIHFVIKYW